MLLAECPQAYGAEELMAVQAPRPSAAAASTQRNGTVGRLALPTSLAGTYAAHVSGLTKSVPSDAPHQPRRSPRSLASASSSASSLAPQSRELSDAHLLLRVESSMASLVNEEDVQAEARARTLEAKRLLLASATEPGAEPGGGVKSST